MTEHKWAEALRAIADGREVEWSGSQGKWFPPNGYNPIDHPQLNWRVAPPAWQEALRQAVRDGKVVEIEFDGEWGWCAINTTPKSFEFRYPRHKYRIRPEPKPDRVVVSHLDASFVPYYIGISIPQLVLHCDDKWNIKYTFDGETGKLKAAEVLK